LADRSSNFRCIIRFTFNDIIRGYHYGHSPNSVRLIRSSQNATDRRSNASEVRFEGIVRRRLAVIKIPCKDTKLDRIKCDRHVHTHASSSAREKSPRKRPPSFSSFCFYEPAPFISRLSRACMFEGELEERRKKIHDRLIATARSPGRVLIWRGFPIGRIYSRRKRASTFALGK